MPNEFDQRGASFARWQAYQIAQFTVATNLVVGLSVAVLGYEVTTLLSSNVGAVLSSPLSKFGFLLSLLSAFASTSIGLWLVVNRLGSFRATARAARLREQNVVGAEIDAQRALYRRLDRLTWCLFGSQIATFAASIALAFLSLVIPAASSLLQ